MLDGGRRAQRSLCRRGDRCGAIGCLLVGAINLSAPDAVAMGLLDWPGPTNRRRAIFSNRDRLFFYLRPRRLKEARVPCMIAWAINKREPLAAKTGQRITSNVAATGEQIVVELLQHCRLFRRQVF